MPQNRQTIGGRVTHKGEGCGMPPWAPKVVYRRLRNTPEIFEAPGEVIIFGARGTKNVYEFYGKIGLFYGNYVYFLRPVALYISGKLRG